MFLKSGILLFLALWISFSSLDKLTHRYASLKYTRPEILYIPDGRGLNFLSFGYRSVLAHTLWFNAISYFGKHYREDKNYKWLAHLCDISTSLAPKSMDYYQFCGTMLSWETSNPDAAIDIYTKAIEQFPDEWLFYYLRGFTQSFFKQNPEASKQDFILSASKPGANPIVVRLASKKIVSSSGPQEAIEFLKNAIEMAHDPSSKSILEHRLEELIKMQRSSDNKMQR